MIVCHCNRVTDRTIRDAVRGGAGSRAEVSMVCRAGRSCGGCVGAIDAHHGSDIPDFIKSLKRIRDSDIEWLLPSHGPLFRKDNAQFDSTIERLTRYQYMADFGTCAIDWPLMQEWEQEIAEGIIPGMTDQ